MNYNPTKKYQIAFYRDVNSFGIQAGHKYAGWMEQMND